MIYRVAHALGKSVHELTESMDIRELAYWLAFFNMHGYSDMRQEFYGAQLAALICQVVSSKGKKYDASDFMLDELLESKAEKEDRELRKHLDFLAIKNAD